jgi:hypothetical protein
MDSQAPRTNPADRPRTSDPKAAIVTPHKAGHPYSETGTSERPAQDGTAPVQATHGNTPLDLTTPEQPIPDPLISRQPLPEHPIPEPSVVERPVPVQSSADRADPSKQVIDVAASEAGEEPRGSGWRPLHPLPRGLVELYGLLAVLFVLVPEWMAGGALLGFRETRDGSLLPPPSGAWKRLPELRLASLTLGEMRLLARQLGLPGYGRDSRERLTSRLLQRLRRQR